MACAALTSLVSLEEYLNTAYRRDVDYVEGRLEERNVGEFDHGALTGILYEIFRAHREEWKIRAALETRMRVTATTYRVPDLCICSLDTPREQILVTPPLLCIEILSHADTFRRMRHRAQEYFGIGVRFVWIIDAKKRCATICRADGSDAVVRQGALNVPGTAIAVPLERLFAALDED